MSMATPIKLSTRNTPRHEVNWSNCPPIMGARMGAEPLTSINSAKNFVNATPSYISRTIAREITIPAAPAIPCTNRRMRNAQIDGAIIQSAEAAP
ncbi:hypothetical protein D3C85_1711970 [compost metagenome]